MSWRDRSGLTHVRDSDREPAPDNSDVWILGPTINRAVVAELCARLAVGRGSVTRVTCDVTAITEPDVTVLDALAWLQLIARRVGCRIEIQGAQRWLVDLLGLAGLEAVLPVRRGSRVEPVGQAEQREQSGRVEEVRDPLDPAGRDLQDDQ